MCAGWRGIGNCYMCGIVEVSIIVAKGGLRVCYAPQRKFAFNTLQGVI